MPFAQASSAPPKRLFHFFQESDTMALSLFSASTSFTAPSVYVPQTAAVRSSAPQMSEPMVSRRGAAAAVAAALFAPAAANAVSFFSP